VADRTNPVDVRRREILGTQNLSRLSIASFLSIRKGETRFCWFGSRCFKHSNPTNHHESKPLQRTISVPLTHLKPPPPQSPVSCRRHEKR
jgi:hypothetical protein